MEPTRFAIHACIVLFGVMSPSLSFGQQVELLDLVTECDILAAHPSDPQRMAEGVADDRIVPRLAIQACEQAMKDDNKEFRFVFQLGRALLAAGKKVEATSSFKKASTAGYAAAWAYLGDAYQFGYEGRTDLRQAYDAYGKALDGGFEPAKALLETLVFDEKSFSSDLVGRFYSGDFREINLRSDNDVTKFGTRTYVFSLLRHLIPECDRAVAPANIRAMFLFGLEKQPPEDIPTQARLAADGAAAEYDAQIFLKRHGCDGPVARTLFANVNTFLNGRPSGQ